MGIFSNSKYSLNKASVSGGGSYFSEPGEYRCKVDKLIAKEGQQGELWFIAELLVVAGNDAIPAGARRSYMANLKNPWGPSQVKQFTTALEGFSSHDPADAKGIEAVDADPKGGWDAIMEEGVGESQPYAGEEVIVVAYPKANKAGKMGIRTKVIPTPESVTKRKAG